MGWNTTVLVLNDSMHQVAEDKEFGAKVAQASGLFHRNDGDKGNYVDINVDNHVNAATVVAQHHADEHHLLLTGGNTIRDLGNMARRSHWVDDPGDKLLLTEVLKKFADSLGYRIVSKAPKQKEVCACPESWKKHYPRGTHITGCPKYK